MTSSAGEISVQVPATRPGEEELDRSLRPQRLEEFVGQDPLKRQLALFIEAARRRNEPLDHVLLAWGWAGHPSRIRQEWRVFARDGWRCTVPGCTSYRNLHAHHVTFRSRGGSDEDANLTTLCAAHHQRGVHGGVIRITGRAPEGLVFELPLGRFAAGDRVVASS